MKTHIFKLHEKALETARIYRNSEIELIHILQEIDELKAYQEFDYQNLHAYATGALQLSESVAYTLITLARKSKQIPELKEKITHQEMKITQARMIAPILTPENQEHWMNKACQLSKRSLEKEIKKQFPEKAVKETIRPVAEKRYELKVGISEELHESIKRVQDLLSQKTGKPASLEEALKDLVEEYLHKKDPLEKAKRVQRKLNAKALGKKSDLEKNATPEIASDQIAAESQGPHVSDFQKLNLPSQQQPAFFPVPTFSHSQSNPQSSPRTPIPASIRHAVNLRDEAQCAYINTRGQHCTEKRWLDFHHRKPVNQGGQHTIDNLMLICRNHHQMHHRAELNFLYPINRRQRSDGNFKKGLAMLSKGKLNKLY